MKIRIKARLANAIALAAIGLIAASSWWSYAEVRDASRENRRASEIALALSQLRLVTSEYQMNRLERARLQWHGVSGRLNRLVANGNFSGPEQDAILAGMRSKRMLSERLFTEFASDHPDSRADNSSSEARGRYETQLLSRLLSNQQDSSSDAFRLTESAAERIDRAQQRVIAVILAGLALIALIVGSASWLVGRDVLAPVIRLQKATREMGSGNWTFRLGKGGNDEVGELSKNFEAMALSLRASFAQVERSNQELAALNKEMEAFSYSVSHDLRAPLRSMDGFSLALLEDYGDKLDAEGKDFLDRIRAASQRMGRLIDDLLVLSRVTRTELKLKPVDLSAMAREIAESLRKDQPGRNVKWRIDENVTVHADKAVMGRAMQNLIENAWKFTARTEGATIHVGAQVRDGKNVVFVADNGVGFDMAHADRLFGAFQRLHHVDDFPGTGIGLAIVQRIVRRHDGRIWAQARAGQGATFFFTLGDSGNEAHRQDHPAG